MHATITPRWCSLWKSEDKVHTTFSIQFSFTPNTGTELSTLLGPHQRGLLWGQELSWIKSTIISWCKFPSVFNWNSYDNSFLPSWESLLYHRLSCKFHTLKKLFLVTKKKGRNREKISKDTFPTQAFKTFCEIELRHIILEFFQRCWKEVSHQ